jgi:anaerobic magnesium-protoporphyrin IX monomethyl ester cyclase
MKTILIGADCEENLGIGMIGAALRRAGHRVSVLAFEDAGSIDEVARAVVSARPHCVGLAIQFQHGAAAHVALARQLRALGYRGHITCGGQHPTMAHVELLSDVAEIDSVVLHEGEQTVVELLAALESGRALGAVPGLAIRDSAGVPTRTAPRALSNALDDLPFAHRYRPHLRHLGLPFIPVWGSRGCWGACAFCAITTAHREAKRHAASRLLRLRSVENLAAEMAALWHRDQSPAIFCFHDDTLLLPRPEDSLERLRSLRCALDELGVGEIGLVGKCRPDCVTPELALALRRLGVFRMFVGIENGSQAGLDHLNRRTKTADLQRALAAFADAGIYTCYNLLLFEPDARLEHVRENIAFMRAHAEFPVNFCRAEAYHGTPLYQRLRERGALIGNYLGWDYRISDDRTELAFRITAAVFRERNFDAVGVANRYIGIAYLAQLLKTFFDCSGADERRVLRQSRELVTAITRESAEFLERVVDIAEHADLGDADAICRETARLGLELSACNRHWHAELDELETSIRLCAERNPRKRAQGRLPERARALFQQLTVAGCLVTSVPGCGGESDDGGNADNQGGAITEQGGATASGSRANGGSVSTNGGRSTADGGASPMGGRQTGGLNGDGGASPMGGRQTGGLNGDGGAPPSGGRATGGWIADPVPTNGGSATGGWVVDRGGTSESGGRATGGLIGDGGVTPVGGKVSAGMAGRAGAPSSRSGGALGGSSVVDPAPIVGRGYGGTYGDGGSPPTAGQAYSAQAGLHAVNLVSPSFVVAAGECTSSDEAAMSAIGDEARPECTTVVDPPPPPRAAPSQGAGHASEVAAFEPTEHWRNTQTSRMPRSQDLPLWDPPEVRLRATLEGGLIAVALCTNDRCISTRWQGEGSIEPDEAGARWQPTSRDDQLSVCVRSEGGVALATLRAVDVPGFRAVRERG